MKFKLLAVTFALTILFYQSVSEVSTQNKSVNDCPASRTDVRDERPRFALLVGIAKYKHSENPDVPGAENDVALMEKVLIENYGFTKKDIKTLRGAQAKRSEIEKGLEFLITSAKATKDKKPIIVFYFSGHGTRYANQADDLEDDDRVDGWDEAIVPWDSRDAGVFDILDDEIDNLSVELAASSSDILYIFDSCHSGTSSRDGTARETKPNPRNAERKPLARKNKLPATERTKKIVELAASLPGQKARPNLAQTNGLMTFHLAAALRRASRKTTYQDLMREVRAAVSSENNDQHPFADGDELRPVLGEASNRADASVPILSDVEEGKFKFGAGAIHGVQTGTQVAIYDKCATKLTGAEGFLTYANVSEVGDREAIAVLPDDKTKLVNKNSRLVLTAPTFGGNPIALLLDDQTLATGNIAAEIRKILDTPNNFLVTNQMVEITDRAGLQNRAAKNQPGAVLQLRRGKFGDVFPNVSRVSLPKCCLGNSLFPKPETEIFYLQNTPTEAEANPLPMLGRYFSADGDLSKVAESIVGNLSLYTRQRNVRNLENANSALNDRVKLEIETLPYAAMPSCKIPDKEVSYPRCQCADGKAAEMRNNQIPQNAYFRITVKNISRPTSQEKLYVAALSVSSDGKIELVNKRTLQDELTTTNPFKFDFVATQPAGMEMLKLVITTNPKDLEGFKNLETIDATNRGETLSPLGKLLNQSGLKTRGNPSLAPNSPNSWGVKTIEWTVTETKFNCGCKK